VKNTLAIPSHVHQWRGSVDRSSSEWFVGNSYLGITSGLPVIRPEHEDSEQNPAAEVKHFNELRERPTRRMLTLDEEKRILDAAPVHLRVAIILLSQTGGRTYSEGFSLRWSQVDFEHKVIRLDNNVKTPGSAEPIPLSQYACDVLLAWKKESPPKSEYVFPSPVVPNRPFNS
jgi:integrase